MNMMSTQKNNEYYVKKFLYPNGTLKNKLNIRDKEKLQNIEYIGSAARAVVLLKNKPKIKTIKELQFVHKAMFGWLYPWAGQIRDYNLSKDNYQFLEGDRQEFGIQNINELLKKKSKLTHLTNLDYAELLDEINYLHPFREGNGRSSKVFLQCLAANHGQVIDFPRKNDEMIAAQNTADIEKISKLIRIQNLYSRKAAFGQLESIQTDNEPHKD
ncbi:hypothetical protein GCM10019817_09470 [Lactobacillus intestinalis]